MREIKFRGFNTTEKTFRYSDWKYGFLSFWDDIEHEQCWKVSQYTGLKDVNGKEIYEGDIIVQWQGYEVQNGRQIRPIRTRIVEWDYLNLCQIQNLTDGNGTVEVIGNIYENRDLLVVAKGVLDESSQGKRSV